MGIELGKTWFVHREEMKGGVGYVGKNSTHTHKGDKRGRRNRVGDGKYVRRLLTQGKETEGGRGRGFLGWSHEGELWLI